MIELIRCSDGCFLARDVGEHKPMKCVQHLPETYFRLMRVAASWAVLRERVDAQGQRWQDRVMGVYASEQEAEAAQRSLMSEKEKQCQVSVRVG